MGADVLRSRLSSLFGSIVTRLSPNRSSRRGAIQCVVIHTTEGSYASAVNWLLNDASDISAHYVVSDIHRPGHEWVEVTAMVPEAEKAWTAKSVNSLAVQYELAGYARRTRQEWLTKYRVQLETTAALVAEDVLQYGIPVKRDFPGILGHGDLGKHGFPNDHTDPGAGFPWDVFLDDVRRFIALGAKPGVKPVKPSKPRPRCLPEGLSRVPKEAWQLAEWQLGGRKGPRPKAPRNVEKAWPWYWDWFRCRFFSSAHGETRALQDGNNDAR